MKAISQLPMQELDTEVEFTLCTAQRKADKEENGYIYINAHKKADRGFHRDNAALNRVMKKLRKYRLIFNNGQTSYALIVIALRKWNRSFHRLPTHTAIVNFKGFIKKSMPCRQNMIRIIGLPTCLVFMRCIYCQHIIGICTRKTR